MRKVLSFVLVLALVLGSFSMVFGASYSDMAGEDSSDAVKVLSELGVVSGYPDGTYKPDRIVTRAEMAKLIVAALGLEKYATATTSKYPDMTAAPWAQGYVAYGTSLGFISGYPDGTFKPNNTVSYEEAASMIVRALGYTSEFLPGEWPAEWMIKANSLGILDDVSAVTGGANRGDVATMLYNALDQKIGYVDADGKWAFYDPADTMLDRLGASKSNAGKAFVLTTTMADAAVVNVRDLVGAYVTAYENSDAEIIVITDVKSVFITGKFKDASDLFDTSDVDYNTNGTASYTDAAGATVNSWVVTNGVTTGTTVAALSDGVEVTIAADVSGKTIKGIYSVATWTVNSAGKVDKFDLEDIDKDQEFMNYAFALDDNDDIDANAFSIKGADSLDAIKLNDIVYVYAYNGDITRIEVSDDVVTGKITAVSSDSKYTINGKAYSVSTAPGKSTTNLVLKNEVKAYLGYDGKIYLADKLSGEADKFAVVLQTEARDTSKIATSEAKVKVFLADGTEKVFSVDKDADIMSGNNVNVSHGAFVKYSVDADGVIDSMVPVNAANIFASKNITASGYVDGKAIASDAKVFTYDGTSIGAFYPTTSALTDDDFGVSTVAKILDTDAVSVWYSVNDDGIVDAIIVAGGSLADTAFGVIVGSGSNDSSAGKYVKMLVDGVAAEYNTALTATTSAVGLSKLYKVTFNPSGEATIIADQDALAKGFAATPTSKASVSLNGYVVSVVSTGAFSAVGSFAEDTMYTLESDVVVYVWDATKYKVGSLSDVRGSAEYMYLFDTDSPADSVYNVVLIKK